MATRVKRQNQHRMRADTICVKQREQGADHGTHSQDCRGGRRIRPCRGAYRVSPLGSRRLARRWVEPSWWPRTGTGTRTQPRCTCARRGSCGPIFLRSAATGLSRSAARLLSAPRLLSVTRVPVRLQPPERGPQPIRHRRDTSAGPHRWRRNGACCRPQLQCANMLRSSSHTARPASTPRMKLTRRARVGEPRTEIKRRNRKT